MSALIGLHTDFAAAHRQYGDKGKCGKLHGHNWDVDIKILGDVGDIGYVVDFKKIKEYIEESFDHKVILNIHDPLVEILQGHEIVALPENPTCENLAKEIAKLIKAMGENIKRVTVRVYENKNSWAEVSL